MQTLAKKRSFVPGGKNRQKVSRDDISSLFGDRTEKYKNLRKKRSVSFGPLGR